MLGGWWCFLYPAVGCGEAEEVSSGGGYCGSVLPVYSNREGGGGGGGERQQSAVLSSEREGCLVTCRQPGTWQTKIATLQT